jgi:hypothetical protein
MTRSAPSSPVRYHTAPSSPLLAPLPPPLPPLPSARFNFPSYHALNGDGAVQSQQRSFPRHQLVAANARSGPEVSMAASHNAPAQQLAPLRKGHGQRMGASQEPPAAGPHILPAPVGSEPPDVTAK